MSGIDPAHVMKARLRGDLVAAMKERRTRDAQLLRALVAALDNAEAPAMPGGPAPHQHAFGDGTAEIARLRLTAADVEAVLLAEIAEREQAAVEFERLGKVEQAASLRDGIRLARRYIG